MKLRLKVLLVLAVMWAIISVIIVIYSKYALTNEYAKLEQHEVIDDIQRTSKTLTNLFSSVKLINNDWSQWDDAYAFMNNKNQAFIKSNLAFTTFENANINLILFYDTKGNLFYGDDYDLEKKKFIPLPTDLIKRLATETAFTHPDKNTTGKIGILKTPEGYLVLSSFPILTSERKGPPRGTLVMGYSFTDSQIIKLSEIVNMKVHFFPLPLEVKDPILNTAYQYLKTGAPNYISPSGQDNIYGFTFIRDIENNPIGILRICSPRDIYNAGVKTIQSFILIMVTIGILFMALVWYLMRIIVLDRIISVSKQVIDINSDSKFSQRIKISGNDEITTMVSAINSLMEIIELTEEQLKYRIFLRTEELDNLSKLNKNLASEINQQREVEVKLREGEKILRHMAYYDTLTGLPNRHFFNEILQKNITKAEHGGHGLAILFLDADKFKSINDTYGHDIGDKFLSQTAKELKLCIKETDVAARISGDEFIICLTNIQGKELISKVAEKILQNISIPFKTANLTISSTFSMGIAIYPSDGHTLEELEKHADLAMYYAKKQNGNTYHYYNEIERHPVQPRL